MEEKIKFDKRPLYIQVQEKLANLFKQGIYQSGERLPSEDELSEALGVSRSTVREALHYLQSAGWIIRRHGIGTFVSNYFEQVKNPLDRAVEFGQMIRDSGRQPQVRIVSVCRQPIQADLLDKLDVSPSSEVLAICKVFLADEWPVILVVNSIPLEIVPEYDIDLILRSPELTEPIYTFLEERCHQFVSFHIADVSAAVTDEQIADLLSCPVGTPLLYIDEVGYNDEERPVFHSREYYPVERMRFRMTRRRSRSVPVR